MPVRAGERVQVRNRILAHVQILDADQRGKRAKILDPVLGNQQLCEAGQVLDSGKVADAGGIGLQELEGRDAPAG